MVSVEEAYQLVQDSAKLSTSKLYTLRDSLGLVLAHDIIAPINLPSFRNSAMDGYAIRLDDFRDRNQVFQVTREIKAGDNLNPTLDSMEAVRIFTGAPIPDSATAVIIQEKATRKNNTVNFNEENIFPEQNIRQIGEQVLKGNVALAKGTIVSPATIGYLASLGLQEVDCFQKPNISIITSGNELIKPGSELKYGEIYESNSFALLSALRQEGIYDVSHVVIPDDFGQTKSSLQKAIESNDILLVTGGVSVGDYDFVGKALNELGVEEIFYKVHQKPGGPLYFGKKNNCLIFGLPGNPAAALSSHYIYVREAINIIKGKGHSDFRNSEKKSLSNYIKKGEKAQFLKGITIGSDVEILEGQSSNMMHTYALANCLVYVPKNLKEIKEGQQVDIISL